MIRSPPRTSSPQSHTDHTKGFTTVATSIAERVAKAFHDVTGETVPVSGSWRAENRTHSLRVTTVPGLRRHTATAQASRRDSLNIEYRATLSADWTSVADMTGLLRQANRTARAFAAIADVLGRDGWHVTPILANLTGWGLRATKGENTVQLYSNGSVSGYDDVAARFVEELFQAALESVED